MKKLLTVVAVSIAVIRPATAAEIIGDARVVDGDSLVINRTRIRLEGVDAPELHQACKWKGRGYRCGRWSALVLKTMIEARKVRCRVEGRDRYGRVLATCFVRNVNLNRQMVRSGAALAYRKYSKAYVKVEALARRDRVGLWKMQFVPPWEWRRSERN